MVAAPVLHYTKHPNNSLLDRFNIGTQLWGNYSGRVDFSMDTSSVIGEGGFRKCFKAKITTESGEKAVAVKVFSDL